MNILDLPTEDDFVSFDEAFGQRFLVTIDTEEEFDWDLPLDRTGHTLTSVPALRTFQQFCEGFGIAPVYFVDYPIATSPEAAEILGPAVAQSLAEIGVHLHPWVNPPFEEEVNPFNSFAGNLPEPLEREKFLLLRDAIETNFATRPLIYRAGRYGAGKNSAAILHEAGLSIDSSVRANFDYAAEGGPDYRGHPLRPYWIDREKRLMELPVTTVYWGPFRQLGGWLYPRLERAPTIRGALSRSGLLERIPLTPEGISAEEAIRAIDIAVDDGLPLLVFSFHSPSLAPGHTPYVRSEAMLEEFYDWWRQIFAYLAKRNIACASVRDVLESVSLA